MARQVVPFVGDIAPGCSPGLGLSCFCAFQLFLCFAAVLLTPPLPPTCFRAGLCPCVSIFLSGSYASCSLRYKEGSNHTITELNGAVPGCAGAPVRGDHSPSPPFELAHLGAPGVNLLYEKSQHRSPPACCAYLGAPGGGAGAAQNAHGCAPVAREGSPARVC